ncbi:MAG: hypothetical protein QF664_07035 [Dehalococcoidia bacterium]|jgi:hypothetical protein|nr:hypothetical protein [Dehalococcoidia bacterium]
MFKGAIKRLHRDEGGHAQLFAGMAVGVPGAIVLTVGAIGEWDIVTAVGGAALAIGVLAATALTHQGVDYSIMSRLDRLESDD